MQGHTYALVGILAADGLAGLFVPVLRVGLTCTCIHMLVSLTTWQLRIRQTYELSTRPRVSHRQSDKYHGVIAPHCTTRKVALHHSMGNKVYGTQDQQQHLLII